MLRVFQFISFLLFFTLLPVVPVIGQGPVFEAKPATFNSPVFSDIAPFLVKDGMIYCSDKRTTSFTGVTTFNNERLYHIYFVEKKDTSDWRAPREIKSAGSPLLYYGPMCLASDGRTVYFTSSMLSGNAARKKNVVNPRWIYIGDLLGTEVSNVRSFEYNNPQYNLAYPSISKDGKYLFFSSDMPGGQGGSDIYFCEMVNNKWSSPVNLGSKVNSPSAENYPYIHPTGRLYFSSDRKTTTSIGGMDIYYTMLSYGNWDEPVVLPADINSSSDDFAFVAEENLQQGYFASNRNRKNDDIFKFSSTIMRKAKCDSLQINNYCYEFVEENAVKFDTMPFRYEWDFGDGLKAQGVKTEHCYKGPGRYVVRLDVVNLITKEVQKNEKTMDLVITDIEQAYISGPAISNAGLQIKLNADSTNLPGWDISQYYWNFDDGNIALGKEVEKVYLKQGSYNIQLIITGAPDANGVIRETCVFKNINVIR